MYNSRLCTVLFYMLTYHRTAYSSYCFFQIFYLWNGTIRYDAAQRDVHSCARTAQGLTTRQSNRKRIAPTARNGISIVTK